MIIKAANGVEIAVFVTDTPMGSEVTIAIHSPGAEPVVVNLSTAHSQAFEVAVIGHDWKRKLGW